MTAACLAACSGSSPPPLPPTPRPPAPEVAAIDRSGATWSALIIDATGRVVAQTEFPAPDRAPLTNGANPVPVPAAVAARALYVAGADGAVRRLSRDGASTVAARFPVAGRQISTLAVSPDGRQVAVSVLTVPAPNASPPGHWRLDQYRGRALGGVLPLLTSTDLSTSLPEPTMVVGWDATGAVAALRMKVTAQGPPISPRFPDTPLVHLDASGALSAPIGGPECAIALDELPDGTTLCAAANGERFEVRDTIGNLRWSGSVNPPDTVNALHSLSSNASLVAGIGVVYRASGGPITLPAGFISLGWLDLSTVVGTGDNGHLSLVPIGRGGLPTDLKIQADYVGAV